MRLLLSLVLAAATGPALAASHLPDPMMVTCGEFAAMDMDGMMAMTDASEMAMMAEGKTDEEVKAMEAEMMAMTDEQKAEHAMKSEEMMKKAMAACEGKADMMMMDAFKMSM